MPPTFGVTTVTGLLRNRASFNKHFREFHGVQQEKKDPPPQQQTPQPQSTTGASAGTGTSTGTGTGTATQASSAKNRQFGCVHCSASFGYRTELMSHVIKITAPLNAKIVIKCLF